MARKSNGLLALAILAASGLAAPCAHAALSEFALGVGTAHPLSPQGEALNRPPVVGAQVWIDGPEFFNPNVQINFGADYYPFAFKNVSGTHGVSANLNVINLNAGLTVWGGPSVLNLRPMFSLGIGALYDFMTMPSSANTTTNASVAFSMRFSAGFEVPLFSRLGLGVELPMTVGFLKPTFAIWAAAFSLRWKL